MGFTNTFGVQVVDMGGYELFVWRCDWRAARFASLTDMLRVVCRFNSPLFVAFVGNARSTQLCLLWLVHPITLLEMELPLGGVCSRGHYVGASETSDRETSILLSTISCRLGDAYHVVPPSRKDRRLDMSDL